MLPGRLGLRFALEAIFLVLLAIGAGLADLRPAVIVLVMAVAWVLVALIEFTAERIAASPTSYLLPASHNGGAESERVPWPPPEERTVVAPPERPARAGTEPEPRPAESTAGAERAEPEVVEDTEPEAQPAPRRGSCVVDASRRPRRNLRRAEAREVVAAALGAAAEPSRRGGGGALRDERGGRSAET
jgi:hypothetical protein